MNIDTPDMPTHDDYKRMLAAIIMQATDEEQAHALALRSKWFIWNHWTAFGTIPKKCPECANMTATMRALNCDEGGNPLDGGMYKNA